MMGVTLVGRGRNRLHTLISIIIPTLNEANGVRKVINEIPREELRDAGYDVEVIVVDGGSTDGTDKVVKELGAHVVYELKKGYGRAYKTGFSIAKGDIIVTLDGDASYSPKVIPQLLKIMRDFDLDFITTRRISSPGAMSLINKVGNLILTLVSKILFRINLEDSQSGMWMFRREVLRDIMPWDDGMAFSEEIKIKAFLCRKKVYECPIPYYRRVGKVKLKKLRDGIRNLLYLFILYIRLRRGILC